MARFRIGFAKDYFGFLKRPDLERFVEGLRVA